MIRVCHIITGLYAHGAERMLHKLLSGLDRERFQTTVISLIDKGTVGPAIEALGIPVLTVDLPRGRPHPAGLLRLIRHVRAAQPDILQGWMYHGNLATSLAAHYALGHPPVIWNIRQSLYDLGHEKRLIRWLVQLSARLSGSAGRIIYNSVTSARQHEDLGFRKDRRVFIPNGFAVDDFAPNPALRARVRNEWGFSDNHVVIGLAARYHPMKDHENFLQAAARVAGQNEHVRFVLAGLNVDTGNADLQQRIRDLQLSGRISLLGEQRDMHGFYQGLDIAILTSAWGEGFPNVLGEAMASGVPCVATEVGDAANIIGETGLTVPARDPTALAGALTTLIDAGQAERARWGLKARERIVHEYSLPAVVGQYAALYADIMG
jgi:glycosyltransferase involved in cell wall biosynthesis